MIGAGARRERVEQDHVAWTPGIARIVEGDGVGREVAPEVRGEGLDPAVVDVGVAGAADHRVGLRRAGDVLVYLDLQVEPGVAQGAHDDVGAHAVIARHVAPRVAQPLVPPLVGVGVDHRLARAEQHVEGVGDAVAVAIVGGAARLDGLGAQQRRQLGPVARAERQLVWADGQPRVAGQRVGLDRPAVDRHQQQAVGPVDHRAHPVRGQPRRQRQLDLGRQVVPDAAVVDTDAGLGRDRWERASWHGGWRRRRGRAAHALVGVALPAPGRRGPCQGQRHQRARGHRNPGTPRRARCHRGLVP
ncbi:MAG: hypothetical protein R3B06_21875 [Kofleriaceae bacterium]